MKNKIDTAMEDAVIDANSQTGYSLGENVSFSSPAELLSSLESLKNEDPEQFTELMNTIADELEAEAEAVEDEDSDQAQMLLSIADRFREAAESGDLAALQPPPPPEIDSDESISTSMSVQSKISAYLSNSSTSSSQSLITDFLEKLAGYSANANSPDYLEDIVTAINESLARSSAYAS